MKFLITSVLVLLVTTLTSISTVYANEDDIKQLRATLPGTLPTATNASIKTTPINGLYEVLTNGQIMYMTKDARFVIDGDLYDMRIQLLRHNHHIPIF